MPTFQQITVLLVAVAACMVILDHLVKLPFNRIVLGVVYLAAVVVVAAVTSYFL